MRIIAKDEENATADDRWTKMYNHRNNINLIEFIFYGLIMTTKKHFCK